MKKYAGTDKDRWMHWLSKTMQKKKLAMFIDAIPAEKVTPRQPGAVLLPTHFYTTIFLNLIKM